MDIIELMKLRHSVRKYTGAKIEQEKRDILDALAAEVSSESGLTFKTVYDEPKCFSSIMAKYGSFKGCNDYIAVIGKKAEDNDEKAGYFGEKLVLKAQELGLNTCWAALTHGKTKTDIAKDEKLIIVISLGYGETQGSPHKNKPLSDVCSPSENMPEWFKRGMEGAMLAPTAVNQQKFFFALDGDKVVATTKNGICALIDLGIAKLHFELASGVKPL